MEREKKRQKERKRKMYLAKQQSCIRGESSVRLVNFSSLSAYSIRRPKPTTC